jgi:hypothetical protein
VDELDDSVNTEPAKFLPHALSVSRPLSESLVAPSPLPLPWKRGIINCGPQGGREIVRCRDFFFVLLEGCVLLCIMVLIILLMVMSLSVRPHFRPLDLNEMGMNE